METLRWFVSFLSKRKIDTMRREQAVWLALRTDRAIVAKNTKNAFSQFFGKLSLSDQDLEKFRQTKSEARFLFDDDVNLFLERVLGQFCKATSCRSWATNANDPEKRSFYRQKADDAAIKLSLLSEVADETFDRYLSYNK